MKKELNDYMKSLLSESNSQRLQLRNSILIDVVEGKPDALSLISLFDSKDIDHVVDLAVEALLDASKMQGYKIEYKLPEYDGMFHFHLEARDFDEAYSQMKIGYPQAEIVSINLKN